MRLLNGAAAPSGDSNRNSQGIRNISNQLIGLYRLQKEDVRHGTRDLIEEDGYHEPNTPACLFAVDYTFNLRTQDRA